MTDRKESHMNEISDIDRLYNRYVAELSKLSELSDGEKHSADTPVRAEASESDNKQDDITDDDLFDADFDDFEIDDYEDDEDDKNDDFVASAKGVRDNIIREVEEPKQADSPITKVKSEIPVQADTPSVKTVREIPIRHDAQAMPPVTEASVQPDTPIAKTKTEITTPPDVKAVPDAAVNAIPTPAVPAMPTGKPISQPEKKLGASEKDTKPLKAEKKTTRLPKAEKTAPHTMPTRVATEVDRGRKSEINRPIRKTVGSGSPYSSMSTSVRSLSVDFLPALLPILIWAVFVYGIRVLVISAVSVMSCVIFELWFEYLIRRRVTVSDLSAVSDGLLISLLMPASVPIWIPVVAAFFGTVIIKCLFGGRGRSLLQPSLAGFAFVSLILRNSVTAFTKPLSRLPLGGIDESMMTELASAYPLSGISGQNLSDLSYTDMIIGLRAGSIGEISILLIAVALIYLLVRRVITWHVPVSFIAVSGALFYLLPRNPVIGRFAAVELLCGIIPLCAVFFASDFTVSPIFSMSKIIYGAGCGACTVLFRYLGLGIYSAVYAVLIMNLLSRPLDMLFVPRPRRKKASVK